MFLQALAFVKLYCQFDGFKVQCHYILYSYSSTSFTLSGMIFPIKQGGCHAMEGHDDDGAETGVHQ